MRAYPRGLTSRDQFRHSGQWWVPATACSPPCWAARGWLAQTGRLPHPSWCPASRADHPNRPKQQIRATDADRSGNGKYLDLCFENMAVDPDPHSFFIDN